jgi:hypothetical protein
MMNKYKLLILLTAMLLSAKTFSQTQSLPVKNAIKLRLPLRYDGLFSQWYTIGLQYERLINAKNSLSLGATYLDSDGSRFFSSYKQVQGYKVLKVLPQWRHYFRRKEENYFNGFYVGGSAAYVKSNIYRRESTQRGHAIGLGGLIGYQKVIKKKLSIDITPSLHYGLENANNPDFNRRIYTVFIGSLDLYVGYVFN